MIRPQIHLNVADNSEICELMCIRIIELVIGDMLILVTLLLLASIVHTCKELKHNNGIIIHFNDNNVVIIGHEVNSKGTQIFGNTAMELR
ncbi:hypothetical protein Lal_00008036 [Lupinus albus]|nr:hypothetical protein Lal_00008036 [Lupinus albus]